MLWNAFLRINIFQGFRVIKKSPIQACGRRKKGWNIVISLPCGLGSDLGSDLDRQ